MSPVLIGFIVYLVVVLAVGVWAYRRNQNMDDFFLGGRKLGPWVVALSERASGESAWLLIGLPGLAYATGFHTVWTALGCGTGILLSWMVVSTRLRAYTGATGALTLPDFFEARLQDRTRALRIVATLIIIFFFTFYVSAQILAAGKVLKAVFEIPTAWGLVIGVAIVLFYTMMGGFTAVAVTDLIQGLLMVFTLGVLPAAALIELGGFEGVGEIIAAADPALLTVTKGEEGLSFALGLIGALAVGWGYVGQPHLLTRFMAIHKTSDLRQGTLIAGVWTAIAFWGAILVGVTAMAKFGAGEITDQEDVMPLLATAVMPPWLAGVMISAAIAAMMSTADSQILVATSALAEDVYRQLLRPGAEQRDLLLVSRLGTVVICGVAFLLALTAEDFVYWLVLFAWAGLGAAFGPPLVLSLWWRRTTRWGALAGMLSGAVVAVVWRWVPELKGLIYELAPAFAVSLLATVLVSLLTEPGEGALAQFERVRDSAAGDQPQR